MFNALGLLTITATIISAHGKAVFCGGVGQACCSTTDDAEECEAGLTCGNDGQCRAPTCLSRTGLVSDNFNCEKLRENWKIFPSPLRGGSKINIDEESNQLDIYVDDDVKQKLGRSSRNGNSAPRIYQQILPPYDQDFEVEVKFDDEFLPDMTTETQDHGIYMQVDNDDSKFIFFASQSNLMNIRLLSRFIMSNNETRIYGNTFDAAPNRLKVKKTGRLFRFFSAGPNEEHFAFRNEFLFEDGDVTGVGIFAGNRNKKAEYRTKVDYFKVFCPAIEAKDECAA